MERDWMAGLESATEADLLTVAHVAASLLVERLADPAALHCFEPLPTGTGSADWSGLSGPSVSGVLTAEGGDGATPEGAANDATAAPDRPWTLPEAQRAVERLSRLIVAAQTSLAGHAATALDREGLRERLLGIPPGKCPFRDAPDWLVQHLRIPRAEARRRLTRASVVLPPPPEPSGHQPGPPLRRLAEAFDGGEIDAASVDLVASVLQDARQEAVLAGIPARIVGEMIRDGEQLLTRHARELAPDTLRKACDRWSQWAQHAVNPDGAEPTDAQRAARQGLRYQGRRRGLHLWHLEADDHQHEVLSVVARAAANPRAEDAPASWAVPDAARPGRQDPATPGRQGAATPGGPGAAAPHRVPSADLTNPSPPDATDRRSTHQRQLDGLVAALTGALALTGDNGLPSSGGLRPQVMVTIDHASLAGSLAGHDAGGTERDGPGGHAGERSDGDPPPLRAFRSEASFAGIVAPRLIRTLACDADILPVVLGGEGQVLDVGRTQRLFPARLRKAITARDGGCAAPGCTMPAPWCEVHHVRYWENGGPTSVDNGVLLCSHHHHTVHGGSWDITMRDGVPWFTPAPHLDPRRVPRRNRHWRP